MPNIVKYIIRKRSQNKALELYKELSTGLSSITEDEINSIVHYITGTVIEKELAPIFWLMATTIPENTRLIELARQEVHASQQSKTMLQPYILCYLLYKDKLEYRKSLIEFYMEAGPLALQEIVADYLVYNGEIEKGLRLITTLMPLTNTDHTAHDHMAILLSMYGTPSFRNQLLNEAQAYESAGDSENAKNLRYAAEHISATDP